MINVPITEGVYIKVVALIKYRKSLPIPGSDWPKAGEQVNAVKNALNGDDCGLPAT